MNKIIDEAFFVSTEATAQDETATIAHRHRPDALRRRMEKIMKLTAAILLIGALHVSASGIAQKVSISVKDVSLSVVFNAIEAQTGFGVIMSNDLWRGAKPVSVDFREATVDEVLEKCFEFQPWKLKYVILGHSIAISKDDHVPSSGNGPGPVKTVKVELTVSNEAGEPLSGANVTIKEIKKGTFTDAKGQCTLPAVQPNSTLVVSFIGYAPQEVKIKEEVSLKIYLKVAKNELDKVVIQAYGTTTQRLATGSIGTVSAEDIAKQPVINPLEALQGQVAGVQVTQTSGYASAPFKVEIRGRSNLNPYAISDPLYIIDGVPLTVLDVSGTASYAAGSPGFAQSGLTGPEGGQSPFFSIDPADIESITVLKDADATAIYGSRGADGVILITTKKGKPGKTHLEMNVYNGTQVVPHYWSMLNTQQYVAIREQALANDGLPVNINNAPDLVAWDTTRYTNWQKYLWSGTGRLTNAELNLSGGDVRTVFRIGAGYLRQSDVQAVTGSNQKGNMSVNLRHNSQNQRLVLNINSIFTYAYINEINSTSAVTLPPNAPAVFNKSGQLNYAGWNPVSYPFSILLQPYTSKTSFITTSLDLSYEILKGLNLKATVGYNSADVKQTNFNTIASQNPAYNPTGYSYFGYNSLYNLIFEPQISYNKYIGKGKLEGLAGGSMQSNSTEGLLVSGIGYTSDALIRSITAAPNQYAADNYGEYKYAAAFGRLNYNVEDKYIINFNARRDGSSRFGPGRQYGNFGSIGAAWIFSQEKFMNGHFPFLSFGKLRGSYGSTGNDKIGDYQYLTLLSSQTNNLYNGIRPILPVGPSDSLLQWEVNHKLEFSLALAFLKDRISFEASWYRNRCNNQLTSFPTAQFTGFSSVTANSPANVQNTGFEFLANTSNIQNKRFSWLTKFNIGINRNKLLAYPNLAQSPYESRYEVGKPLNNAFLLHWTGVDPQTGLYTFQDKNKDGQITVNFGQPVTGDDRYFYDLTPRFTGGITNTFSYRNWNLSIFLYFTKTKGVSALASINTPGEQGNAPTSILHHWQEPGDISTNAKLTTESYNSPSYGDFSPYSDGIYCDASFIRCQNMALSYHLPLKGHSSDIKLFIKGENLFTITRYDGVDPEIQTFGALPLLRTMTAGVTCNF